MGNVKMLLGNLANETRTVQYIIDKYQKRLYQKELAELSDELFKIDRLAGSVITSTTDVFLRERAREIHDQTELMQTRLFVIDDQRIKQDAALLKALAKINLAIDMLILNKSKKTPEEIADILEKLGLAIIKISERKIYATSYLRIKIENTERRLDHLLFLQMFPIAEELEEGLFETRFADKIKSLCQKLKIKNPDMSFARIVFLAELAEQIFFSDETVSIEDIFEKLTEEELGQIKRYLWQMQESKIDAKQLLSSALMQLVAEKINN